MSWCRNTEHEGGCSLHRTAGAPQTGRLNPQKWSEKASSDRPQTLSRTSDHLSPRDKMSSTYDPSTNQMVSHGVPNNVLAFPVSH